MSDRALLEKARRELLWRKCQRDEKYALRTFWSIKVPGIGRMLFDLRDAQEQALDHWAANRYSLTLKARQIGWSTCVTAHCWWSAYFQPDREILLISRGEREAGELLAKVKYGLKFLPEWMQKRGPSLTTDSKTRLDFSNGSSIISLPSASDPARGFSGYEVIVDEWAFLNDPDSAWASIEPVADVGGRIIGLSTANGYGNFFHTLWVQAETGVNQFKTMFHNWRAGGRDDDWYETKKRTLPEWQLAQEYPDNPEEAFLKSGNPVFDLDVLQAMESGIMTPRIGALVTNPLPDLNESTAWPPEGPLRVFEKPQMGHGYVIGADVAEGLEHGDFSCAQVLDAESGVLCAVWHGKTDPDLFGEALALLGRWYNGALIGVEINNHGHVTVGTLRRLHYPRIFRRRVVGQITEGYAPQYGWHTNKVSKPQMIEGLNTAIRDRSIEIHDEHTLAELRTYIREYTQGGTVRMHGSPYDDRTMALAIAVQMLAYTHVEHPEEVEDTRWTLDWWQRQMAAEEAANRKPVPLGSTSVRRVGHGW